MIIRVFRPTIHPGKEREFEAFLRDTAVPLVSQQAGLVAQHVETAGLVTRPPPSMCTSRSGGRRVDPAFAGERWQQAVITPDEEHLLKRHLDRALRGPPDTRLTFVAGAHATG